MHVLTLPEKYYHHVKLKCIKLRTNTTNIMLNPNDWFTFKLDTNCTFYWTKRIGHTGYDKIISYPQVYCYVYFFHFLKKNASPRFLFPRKMLNFHWLLNQIIFVIPICVSRMMWSKFYLVLIWSHFCFFTISSQMSIKHTHIKPWRDKMCFEFHDTNGHKWS